VHVGNVGERRLLDVQILARGANSRSTILQAAIRCHA